MQHLRPSYYNTDDPYEPLKVIDAWGVTVRVGFALKHIARRGKKAGNTLLEDLIKAYSYLGLEIERVKASQATPTAMAEAPRPKTSTERTTALVQFANLVAKRYPEVLVHTNLVRLRFSASEDAYVVLRSDDCWALHVLTGDAVPALTVGTEDQILFALDGLLKK